MTRGAVSSSHKCLVAVLGHTLGSSEVRYPAFYSASKPSRLFIVIARYSKMKQSLSEKHVWDIAELSG